MKYQNHNLLEACGETAFQPGFLFSLKKIKRTVFNLTPIKKTVAAITMIALVTAGYYSFFIYDSKGASYTFNQTSWSGGQTSNAASHTSNQTGWNEYASKDINVSIISEGEDVNLSSINASVVQTSDTDFNAGNFSDSIVSGTGSSAKVSLNSYIDGGTGADGTLDLSLGSAAGGCNGTGLSWSGSTCTINSDTKSTFNFTDINISSGKILKGSGSNAIILNATGTVSIAGTININGSNGQCTAAYTCVGGSGGPGGYKGADQSTSYVGGGPGPGSKSSYYAAGGAGHGGAGGVSGYGGANGSAYDIENTGGSGGGSSNGNYSSSGGGGGGGSIKIVSHGTVSISGTISANGGSGVSYNPANTYGYGGGGGSGGRIKIVAPLINQNGTLNAIGGNGVTKSAGGGAGGRIILQDFVGVPSGSTGTSVGGGSYGTGTSNGSPGSSGVVSTGYVSSTYSSSGTFTSSVLDLAAAYPLSAVTFDKTTPTNTSVTIDVRAGNTATPDETWTSWQTNVSSGGSISSLGSKRYVQYRANLATSDSSVTPSLDDVTINYNTFIQTLISNVYNTTFDTAQLKKIEWTENLPDNTDIQFQLRTSSDGLNWTEWQGSNGTSSYFTDPIGNELMPAVFTGGNNDQYFQYKVFLSSTDGVGTPTLSDVTITYNDSATPVITGVVNGATYFESVTPITENGTATLNGSPYTSGTPITENGTYTLSVDNGQGTTVSATFIVVISKTIINPNPTVINNDVNDGIIFIFGEDPTETAQVTINTNYILSSGTSQLTIPKDTVITPTEGGNMNITSITVSDISENINNENSNSKGAVKIGIPNQGLTFSQPVSITMNVNSSYEGKTLEIYSRPDTGGDWTYETTCNVSDNECTFTTDHATEYTGNYEVSNSPTPTDVNVGIDPTISLTCSDNLTLGTITGTGQSNLTTNEAVCTVGTINSSGYQLSWLASTAYMENENGDQISPYTPQTPATPETWSVASTESEWGGRVKSTSTDPDLTGEEIWDNLDSYSGTWLNVSTDPFVIANRTTETSQAGSTETILFGAEIGSNKFQPTGTYDVDVTFTATTL